MWAEEAVPSPETLGSDCALITHDGVLTDRLAKHLDLDLTREQQMPLGNNLSCKSVQCLDLRTG